MLFLISRFTRMRPEFAVVATGETISLPLHVFISFSGIVNHIFVGCKEKGSD
jgi:hypothetical protein